MYHEIWELDKSKEDVTNTEHGLFFRVSKTSRNFLTKGLGIHF
jgi:hypothetical protein